MAQLAKGAALAALVGLLIVGVLVSSGSTDEQKRVASQSACPIGQDQPATPVPEEEAAGIRPTSPHIVIGCGNLPREGRFWLVSYRQTAGDGRRSHLCIDVRYVRLGYSSGGCGFRPLRGAIDIGGVGRTTATGFGLTLSGMTSARAVRVLLRYRKQGGSRGRDAALVRVLDRDILNRLMLNKGFGYYLVDVPGRASNVSVTAFDGSGSRLDRATLSSR
jgi:hypothetical protein